MGEDVHPGIAIHVTRATEIVQAVASDRTGQLSFSGHVIKRMRDRELSSTDIVAVLRCGTVTLDGFEKGSYRYRVATSKFTVMVCFQSAVHVVVVSAWRTTS